mgnify:CR=1 FL=1
MIANHASVRPNLQCLETLCESDFDKDDTLLSVSNSREYRICQVVDREEREDLEEQTITKVVRQGFRVEDKVLRPIEVITSKKIQS